MASSILVPWFLFVVGWPGKGTLQRMVRAPLMMAVVRWPNCWLAILWNLLGLVSFELPGLAW